MVIEKLHNDMKEAMKAKDKLRTTIIKEIIGEAKNIAIENRHDVCDDDCTKAILKVSKICKDQIDTCPKDRVDKLEEFNTRYKIVSEYLPKQLSEAELRVDILELIKNKTFDNKGAMMKFIMPALRGSTDGKLINKVATDIFELMFGNRRGERILKS